MKRNFSPILAACLALALQGCGKSDNDSSGSATATKDATGAAPKKQLKLAFVVNNSAAFWTIARAGTEEAAKQLGNVDVDFRIPSDGQAGTQRQILDDLLAKGVDGIAVSPIDPGNQTEFLNRVAGKTLLICHDSDAPESKRVCYIGTDNFAAGVEAGKLIKEALPNGGKIVLFVGFADAQNAKDRFGGIKKELEGSNIQILELRTDDADPVRAQKNAEDTLVKTPDISALVGLYSYNGPAILGAVRRAGKTSSVKIICFDDEDETLAGVAAGDIYGTVAQQPYEFGKQAITKMAKYLEGDKEALAGGKQIIPTVDVKKDNAATFLANKNKMLGK